MNVLLAALFCIVLHRLFKKGGVTKGAGCGSPSVQEYW